jgi:hypothetical protein
MATFEHVLTDGDTGKVVARYAGIRRFSQVQDFTPGLGLVVAWFDGEPDLWVYEDDAALYSLKAYYRDDGFNPDTRPIPFQIITRPTPTEVNTEACAAGMKLVRVSFVMQVGAGAPLGMIATGIRKLVGGDPLALDSLKGNPMSPRTQQSVRVEEVSG